jgi:hypothetical protein
MSRVTISNVYVETIFEWFYSTICFDGGDGAGVICCANHEETADAFIEWWKKRYLPKAKESGYKLDEFFHEKDEYPIDGIGLMINYHDSNENVSPNG